MVKALAELGEAPFFHLNSDTIWIDGVKPNLARLADAFDADKHGRAAVAGAGHRHASAIRDAAISPWRRTDACARAPSARWCPSSMPARQFFRRRCLPARRKGEFPLTDPFARAAEAGRLYGLRLEGLWMHVGTPDAIAGAEAAIRASTG